MHAKRNNYFIDTSLTLNNNSLNSTSNKKKTFLSVVTRSQSKERQKKSEKSLQEEEKSQIFGQIHSEIYINSEKDQTFDQPVRQRRREAYQYKAATNLRKMNEMILTEGEWNIK